MTCEDFRLRLTAFSLGELEQGERQRTRDHLAACDDCASRVLVDRQLTALLRASAVPAPSETRAAVLAAVRAEAGAGPRPACRRLPLAGRPLPGRPGAGTGSPWPPPCWPPPPWSPRPCWWCRPPTRAARCPRPGARTTTGARTASAPRARPRPSGCSRSSGRPRAPPTWPPSGSGKDGWEARDLAGHVAAVAEYRDAEGGRVTLMRWRGDLPRMAKGTEGGEAGRLHLGPAHQLLVAGRRRRLVPGRHHRPGTAVRDRRAPGRGIVGRPAGLGC